MRARILAVGVQRDLFEKIDPLLNRSYFTVDRVPRAGSGLVLCDHVGFDLILVGDPLPDMPLEDFLSAVRRRDAPSAGSHVFLLAGEATLAALGPAVRSNVNEALAIEQPRRILEEVASRLLKVAPRLYTRLLVKLEVEIDQARRFLMCQTENVSEGGMLVRTEDPYPVGTRVGFELPLPGDRSPVRGSAEVVRHTVAEVEKVRGVGMRFTEIKEDGLKRLQVFLKRQGVR